MIWKCFGMEERELIPKLRADLSETCAKIARKVEVVLTRSFDELGQDCDWV